MNEIFNIFQNTPFTNFELQNKVDEQIYNILYDTNNLYHMSIFNQNIINKSLFSTSDNLEIL